MGRAIIGTGSGYGSTPKILLDDDCGTPRPCAPAPAGGPGTVPVGPGDTAYLPLLQIVLRQRVGYDNDEGRPLFDWVPLAEGHAFAYEAREEWDAEAGATVVKAEMILPNTAALTDVPETAVIRERSTGTLWNITATSTHPDRIEVSAYRVWSETVAPTVEQDWTV